MQQLGLNACPSPHHPSCEGVHLPATHQLAAVRGIAVCASLSVTVGVLGCLSMARSKTQAQAQMHTYIQQQTTQTHMHDGTKSAVGHGIVANAQPHTC